MRINTVYNYNIEGFKCVKFALE